MGTLRKAVFVVFAIAIFQAVSSAQNAPGVFIQVHSETGQPVGGVEIRVEKEGASSARVITDAQGKAAINGLTAGSYRVIAALPGFEESAQSFAIGDERQEIDIDVVLHGKLQRNDQIEVVANAQ